MLDSGISLIDVIKEKIQLLCNREGLRFTPDNNSASMIERFSVAVNALLITGIIFDYSSNSSIWMGNIMIFKKDDLCPFTSLEISTTRFQPSK